MNEGEFTGKGTGDVFYVAVPGHLVADAAGEVVILHRDKGTYYGLNEVGRRLWGLIQERASLGALVTAIAGEYAVDREVAARDVERLMLELIAEGLALRVS